MCGVLIAGGSAEDYARANRLRGMTRGKVVGSKLEAHWLDGGRMWYRADHGDGAYEYVLVDAEKGEKGAAFDHERMAEAFRKAGEADVRAGRLGIDELKFGPGDEWVEVTRRGKVWRYDAEGDEVEFVRYDDGGLLRAIEPGEGPERSGGARYDSSVTFVNCTDETVELFWLDSRGDRQSYGKLGPGDQMEQHTYAGHVWVAADEMGEAIAKYVAKRKAGTALIGKDVEVEEKEDRRERTRRDRAVSPDGEVRAFIREHNVWVRMTDGGEEVQLSRDGTADRPYTGEFYFSPDSRKLVVMRTKKGEEHKVYMVESSPRDQVQPKLHTIDYLKPGDEIPLDRPYLFDLRERADVEVGNELFENPWSITRLAWDGDSGRFTFVYNQRGHQVLRVVAVDAETGKAEAIIDERSDTFICYSSKMYYRYMQKTGEMIWMSERDGWNHLYLYDANTGEVKCRITGGAPRRHEGHEGKLGKKGNRSRFATADLMLGLPAVDDIMGRDDTNGGAFGDASAGRACGGDVFSGPRIKSGVTVVGGDDEFAVDLMVGPPGADDVMGRDDTNGGAFGDASAGRACGGDAFSGPRIKSGVTVVGGDDEFAAVGPDEDGLLGSSGLRLPRRFAPRNDSGGGAFGDASAGRACGGDVFSGPRIKSGVTDVGGDDKFAADFMLGPSAADDNNGGAFGDVGAVRACGGDAFSGPRIKSGVTIVGGNDKFAAVGPDKDGLLGSSGLRLPRGFAARNDGLVCGGDGSVGTGRPTAAVRGGAKADEVEEWIAKGEWVVREVVRVDEAKREILFKAGGILPGQDPYYVHYARVNFDGTGLTVLTEGDGTHEVEFSPDGKYFVDSYSRVDMPGVHELRRSEDGELVCELERADWSTLLATGWQVPERFAAKGRDGETDIYGVIWRPTNFDASKKYPVIESIYAGPHGFFTPKGFRSYYGQQRLAELGFIVVKCDGMGTNGRSKAFHDVCWKNLKDSGFPDRIAWMKAAAKDRPWMDVSRVGIYGGSAGGQSAACAVMTQGDFYDAAVADCGCHDNRMDKIWWNEQWMGWPVDESYAENSNVTLAKGLEGKLMLTVGELDKNVDPASTMQVVDALIRADKDFDLIVFPGGGHGAGGSAYGRRRRADYFVRHLLGVEPRY
nr:prolyl oligopeptidase family serine peptidase [Anaerohalosphaera lusitana]